MDQDTHVEVLPVIDLRDGQAVHARGGNRDRYPVVEGVLGSGRDPLALALAFRDRLGCRSVYVADLDAIADRGDARPFVARLTSIGLAPLIDAGVRTVEQAKALLEAGAARVVVGLETLHTLDELGVIVRAIGAERVVFSLDLRNGSPLVGSPALATADPLWLAEAAVERGVRQMICLDLARVGSGAGAPHPLLTRLRARLPHLQLFAGGGVRDVEDLAALAALGCAGALVATALHNGRITGAVSAPAARG